MKDEIERALEHIGETHNIRKKLWHMDERVENLRYGIRQGDDAIVVGDIVMNMEGPYPMKIGRKTGLIHTCSDVVIMGARPLFALNAMQVNSIKEAEEIVEDLKKQSTGLGVPIVGGNTQTENELTPCVSFAVYGKLVKKPVPDCGAQTGDRIFMLGSIVEGEIGERVYRAKTKFDAFLEMVEKDVKINASKDCSRGGWFGNLMEILVKSKRGIKITSIPYPRLTRYMGTYLISVPETEDEKVIEIATKHKCPIVGVGDVTNELAAKIGAKTVVNKRKFESLVRNTPYKKVE